MSSIYRKEINQTHYRDGKMHACTQQAYVSVDERGVPLLMVGTDSNTFVLDMTEVMQACEKAWKVQEAHDTMSQIKKGTFK